MSSTQKPELVRSPWPFRLETGEDQPANGPVLVVDDHDLIAEVLVATLRAADLDAVALAVGGVDDLVGEIVRRRPGLVLLDYLLGPHGPAGALVVELTERSVPVIVLTGVVDRAAHGECIQAGALGVIQKQESLDRLVDGVRRALTGLPVMEPEAKADLRAVARRRRRLDERDRRRFKELTRREADVLEMLCTGESPADIAEQSYVALSTVRSQIRSIYQKLEVTSQLEAVAYAHRCGWYARRTTAALMPGVPQETAQSG